MASSPDLVHWQRLRDGARLHDAMPVLPPWARSGFTWAPEVLQAGRRYILYFTARDRESGLQCIGAASAEDPRGPFVSAAVTPLVCQPDLGGSIDPHAFRDADGRAILYFKNDGNNPAFRKPTRIYAQRLSADGLSLEGKAVAVLKADAAWEGDLVEAPTMVRHGGRYTLFFSANDYGWVEQRQRLSSYAIGYASCSSALGPCRAGADNPLLPSRSDAAGCLSGPGHQAVFRAGGRFFMAFHAWETTIGCAKAGDRRNLYIASLHWRGAKPRVAPRVSQPMAVRAAR